MALAPQSYDQQRQLLKALLLKMMQDELAQQGKSPPKISNADQLVDYAKKAKNTYDDAKNLYNAGTSGYNYLFGPTYSAATQAAWNQAAGQASQAAWNAGADAASGIGSSAGTSATGATPTPNYAGYAAAALSAYNDYNKLTGDNLTDEEKSLEATRAVPRAVAAFYTGGLSNLGENFARNQWGGTAKKLDNFAMKYDPFVQTSKLWTSDKWKTEGKRLGGLQEKGINIPEFLQAAMQQKKGRKTKDLINPYLPKDFVGETPQYGWTNNKFAGSRSENDLTGKDIWGYSAFFDKFGNDWLGGMSPQQREAIANKALERKAVNEHHGTIDINWTPELEADITAIRGSKIPKAPQAQPAKRPPAPTTVPQDQPLMNKPSLSNLKGIFNNRR